MTSIGVLVVVLGFAVAYGMYFRRRAQIAKAGGITAHSKAHLGKLFELPADEQVTAAWSAVTVPKLSKAGKAAEVVGAAAAVIVGVGVKVVGRDMALALTSRNRLLVLDKDAGDIRAFGPDGKRPAISQTDKKGTQRPSQTRMGWDDGAIMKLETAADDVVEIDVVASAVPVLVAWSQGDDASRLDGPYPIQGTI